MRIVHALLTATLLVSSASAQSLESLRVSADAALLSALPRATHPDLEKPREPILQAPLDPRPIRSKRAPGPVVGKAALSALLSANRRVASRQFGARTLDFGMGTDAAFSSYFLTFSDPQTTRLAALGDLNRLRGAGVNAHIDAKTVYNFKVSVNLFSPVRGSTLKMTPVSGTAGPKHEMKTGALLDAIRAKSFVFKAKGQEFWLLYDHDALPDGTGYASTRSFLFIKENGLSSKAWPLAEAKLPLDAMVAVDLGGVTVNLTRAASGQLFIRE